IRPVFGDQRCDDAFPRVRIRPLSEKAVYRRRPAPLSTDDRVARAGNPATIDRQEQTLVHARRRVPGVQLQPLLEPVDAANLRRWNRQRGNVHVIVEQRHLALRCLYLVRREGKRGARLSECVTKIVNVNYMYLLFAAWIPNEDVERVLEL